MVVANRALRWLRLLRTDEVVVRDRFWPLGYFLALMEGVKSKLMVRG